MVTNRTTVMFPPIPLATGDQFTDDSGNHHDLTSVTVHLTGPDGAQKTVELQPRLGGWWGPTDI